MVDFLKEKYHISNIKKWTRQTFGYIQVEQSYREEVMYIITN